MPPVCVQIIDASTRGVNISVNFDLTEDEQLLKAVAERFVADRYDLMLRRSYLESSEGFSTKNWAVLGELGLIAAPFDPSFGGLGASQTDIALIAETFGRGLVVEPWTESILVAAQLFAASASVTLRKHWIPGIVSGAQRLALAHREPGGRGPMFRIRVNADRASAGWLLNGSKSIVIAGVGADGILISAKVQESDAADDNVRFFLVPAATSGMFITPYRLIDGSVASEITLRNVLVPQDHQLDARMSLLRDIEARAAIARCAEALGIMHMLFDLTAAHLRTRKQFGVHLGSFQALQHRMVAQYAIIEQARALLDLAVMTEPTDPAQWHRAIAGARAFISDASVTLGHEMIQLHGAIGVADELIVGHGHKRLMLLSRYPETAEIALDDYTELTAESRALIQPIPRRSKS